MNIGLYNLENKYKNLALEKIRKYHTDNGDTVTDYYPMMHDKYDKIYCSSIFKFTDKSEVTKDMICGGTGFDLTTKLPDEIEEIKPRLNFGFTQRGCIRNCSFCVVPQKEGKSYAVGDVYDLWDGKSKEVELIDNNPQSLEDHFYDKICKQLRDKNIKVFFHGLDLRLTYNNRRMVEELKSIRHYQYKFAWDLDDNSMIKKLEWLKHKIGRCLIYVIVGIIGWEKEMKKFEILKKIGHDPYCMRFETAIGKHYVQMARWVNQPAQFKKKTFQEFTEVS